MSTRTEALRTAIAVLTAQLAIEEGKPATAYLPAFDTDEAERKRLAEIAERQKPHVWRDWTGGLPEDAGDNDRAVQKDYDDLLRAFGPFIDHLGKAKQVDSEGVIFDHREIKKRGGIGIDSIRLLRDEIRGKWYSEWGAAWRAHPLNANLLPKPEVVEALFAKDYGAG